MNISYLMEHISYQLHTVVKRYLPDKNADKEYLLEHPEYFCARYNFEDQLADTPEFHQFLSGIHSGIRPLFVSAGNDISYAAVPLREGLFLIGPVRFKSPVTFNHTITYETISPSWLAEIAVCEFDEFLHEVMLLYNLFHETVILADELITDNCIHFQTQEEIQQHFSKLIFYNQELEQTHNPYEQEIREFTGIETGDLELLRKSHAEDYTGKIGTLSLDPLRHARNLGIVIVTLASRAAIRGGLIPEVSFSLSDSYIQQIEQMTDIPAIHYFMREAEYQYAQMVRELKQTQPSRYRKDQNPRVEKCKDYIFSHLHGKIRLEDIARELYLNVNYLSDIFKQYEGISITQYIIREKIGLTKNLLAYSLYSYSEIAAYLSFSSQSHLGYQFKKITGMTLRQYRDKYGIRSVNDMHGNIQFKTSEHIRQ